jgi:hypothetical protein
MECVLEIARVGDESCSVIGAYNIEHLQHIVQNPVVLHGTVVVVMAAEKVLDLGEGLFDGVEIRGVWREIFDADAKTISSFGDLDTVVDGGVVENEDTEGTGIWATEW